MIASFEDVLNLKLNRSDRAFISNAEIAYKNFDYPIVMHLAMRRLRMPNQIVSKRLRLPKSKVKRMAQALGVTDPKTKICASGKDHPKWKCGSITDKWIWNQEVKQLKAANKKTDWSQHPEIKRWLWKQKYHNSTPEQKIKIILRKRIRAAVKRQNAEKSINLNTGCSSKFLRQYLEARWQKGMTWNNYGTAWHIDHVKPLIKFNLRRKKDQRAANHYSNLQPLWASDNSSKGSKSYEQINLFKFV